MSRPVIGLFGGRPRLTKVPCEELARLGYRDALTVCGRELYRDRQSGVVFVRVPAGEFKMGAGSDDDLAIYWERPEHRVRISRDFLISVTEVTIAQWNEVMRNDPIRGNPDLPAAGISPGQIREFLYRTGFRLATEAEWEYACKAGTPASRYGPLHEVAWCTDLLAEELIRDEASDRALKPVGQKSPNAFGVYDMLGNALELTSDCFEIYEPELASATLQDPEVGCSPIKWLQETWAFPSFEQHVIKGGSAWHGPLESRASWRSSLQSDWPDYLGMRVVTELPAISGQN